MPETVTTQSHDKASVATDGKGVSVGRGVGAGVEVGADVLPQFTVSVASFICSLWPPPPPTR